MAYYREYYEDAPTYTLREYDAPTYTQTRHTPRVVYNPPRYVSYGEAYAPPRLLPRYEPEVIRLNRTPQRYVPRDALALVPSCPVFYGDPLPLRSRSAGFVVPSSVVFDETPARATDAIVRGSTTDDLRIRWGKNGRIETVESVPSPVASRSRPFM
eukprot:TRINITY_DN12025_c0_g1_i1.p1 TRINITY_DN12025_c0_g1~~TRINITY_DN12025_c0_g1_i1.p1  ORF type:complete len:165 (+),score=13.12 TRINITY_DN12025_c0_g1_i1:28-495(+)